MEKKILYTIGNFFSGQPYGVECERSFGVREMHGPFTNENAANTYMHEALASYNEDGPYLSLKVVKIETPQAGRHIIRKDGAWEYVTEEATV